jgi:hypothetical protein
VSRYEPARVGLVGDAFALRERHIVEVPQECDDDLAKRPVVWVVSWVGALVGSDTHVDAETAMAVSS